MVQSDHFLSTEFRITSTLTTEIETAKGLMVFQSRALFGVQSDKEK